MQFKKAFKSFGLASVLIFSSCGKIDQEQLTGYWTVSSVKTEAVGNSAHNKQQRDVTAGYIMAIQGQRVSFPSYGSGMQQLDLGGSTSPYYNLDGDRILVGKAEPIRIEEVNENKLILSQEVMDPEYGKTEVTQELKRLEPFQARQLLQSRNEAIPPELENNNSGYGRTGYPTQNPPINQPMNQRPQAYGQPQGRPQTAVPQPVYPSNGRQIPQYNAPAQNLGQGNNLPPAGAPSTQQFPQYFNGGENAQGFSNQGFTVAPR